MGDRFEFVWIKHFRLGSEMFDPCLNVEDLEIFWNKNKKWNCGVNICSGYMLIHLSTVCCKNNVGEMKCENNADLMPQSLWRKTSFIWWVEIKTKLFKIHTRVQKCTVKSKNSLALRVIFVAAVKQNAFDAYLHTVGIPSSVCPPALHEHLTLTSGQQKKSAPVGAQPLSAPCVSSNYRTKHSFFFFFLSGSLCEYMSVCKCTRQHCVTNHQGALCIQ